MKTGRLGFGACFARNKKYVVVAGGFSTGFTPTKKTEVFNVGRNVWTETQPMLKPRTALSLCEAAGSWLYAFGG